MCQCYVFLKLSKCYSRPTLLVRVYAITHWITLTKFIGFLLFPRLRIYLGTRIDWLGNSLKSTDYNDYFSLTIQNSWADPDFSTRFTGLTAKMRLFSTALLVFFSAPARARVVSANFLVSAYDRFIFDELLQMDMRL